MKNLLATISLVPLLSAPSLGTQNLFNSEEGNNTIKANIRQAAIQSFPLYAQELEKYLDDKTVQSAFELSQTTPHIKVKKQVEHDIMEKLKYKNSDSTSRVNIDYFDIWGNNWEYYAGPCYAKHSHDFSKYIASDDVIHYAANRVLKAVNLLKEVKEKQEISGTRVETLRWPQECIKEETLKITKKEITPLLDSGPFDFLLEMPNIIMEFCGAPQTNSHEYAEIQENSDENAETQKQHNVNYKVETTIVRWKARQENGIFKIVEIEDEKEDDILNVVTERSEFVLRPMDDCPASTKNPRDESRAEIISRLLS